MCTFDVRWYVQYLKYVETVKHFGVVVVNAAKSFKYSMEHIHIRFYRVCKSLYAKTRDVNSEPVTVELMKVYRMPFILYATEAFASSNIIISIILCKTTVSAKLLQCFFLLGLHMEITLCLSNC